MGVADHSYEVCKLPKLPELPWISEGVGVSIVPSAHPVYFRLVDNNGYLQIEITDDSASKKTFQLLLKEEEKMIMSVTATGSTIDALQLQESINHGQEYIIVSQDIYDHLALGSYQKSAAEYVRSILHEYLGYNNTISITGVPLYHLDVNSRISVEDDASDIHGDYIIQSINMPLDPSGNMTISAVKAIERI